MYDEIKISDFSLNHMSSRHHASGKAVARQIDIQSFLHKFNLNDIIRP